MKKTAILLTALILLCASVAAADEHIEITCSFSGAYDNRMITCDLYETDRQFVLVSSLLSDYAAKGDCQDIISPVRIVNALFSLTPQIVPALMNESQRFLSDWLYEQPSVITEGAFSGELFDYASSMKEATFPVCYFLNELNEYSSRRLRDSENTDYAAVLFGSVLTTLSGQFEKTAELSSADLIVRNYDQGRYLSAMIVQRDDVLATVSLDLSRENEKRYLFGHKEEDRFVYQMITAEYTDADSSFSSELYVSSYPFGQTLQRPVLTETLSVRSDDQSACSFRYTLSGDTLTDPLVLSGRVTEKAILEATAVIGESDSAVCTIRAEKEELIRKVSFSDKKLMDINHRAECAELERIAISEIMILVADIAPFFPDVYQRMMYSFFF